MKMLITAMTLAATTPVAAQTTDPVHSKHEAPAPDRNAKDCCCCDGQTAEKVDPNRKKMACCGKNSGDPPAATPSKPHH